MLQGAVLSCLLFNIMIDDLETAIQKVPGVSYLFFADDLVIWVKCSNIRSLEDALNSSLLNLATWANTNKMEVSVEKTVSQLFTLSTKQHPFHLEYKGLPLEQVSLCKYLGINLDMPFTVYPKAFQPLHNTKQARAESFQLTDRI
ncbi:putative RNA-directed DNA polymerase from transposon BS [Trichonephila clavata]|uniref:Putative RNA-directed DNA polymerase from transposon BS n=1 Tax=Trichonephila clavata TaxID=2740835 RepID=A0A8X6IH39_TRICU|nr:putative RNA-directed DNA polymerase from transposon BS [Trichonephila clavata]